MSVVELVNANAICTARQLGEVLGLSMRQIHHLEGEGVLKQSRSKSSLKRYSLAESVQAYLAYQRKYVAKECSKDTAAYDSVRTRRMAALAEVEEMRLKQSKGELLRRDRIVLVMTSLLTQTKNHMLGLPTRLTRQLVMQRDPNKIRSILDAAVRNCLIECSKFGSHSFDEHGKQARAQRTNSEHNDDD